jgi:hypothetical protein
MKKSDRESLHNTLALAAAIAALGTSVGATLEQALAATPAEEQSASQSKTTRKQGGDAAQGKIKGGASQLKLERKTGAPGSDNSLNPQPLPPKQGIGATQQRAKAGASQMKGITGGTAGGQLPAVQR